MALHLEWSWHGGPGAAVEDLVPPGTLASPFPPENGLLKGTLLSGGTPNRFLFRPLQVAEQAVLARPFHPVRPLRVGEETVLTLGDVLRSGTIGVRLGGETHRPVLDLGGAPASIAKGAILPGAGLIDDSRVLQHYLRLERRLGAAEDPREGLEVLARGLLDAVRGSTWVGIVHAETGTLPAVRLSLAEEVEVPERKVIPLDASWIARVLAGTEARCVGEAAGPGIIAAPTTWQEEWDLSLGPEDVNGLLLVAGEFMELEHASRLLYFFRQRVGALLHAEATEVSRRSLRRQVNALAAAREEARVDAEVLRAQAASLAREVSADVAPRVAEIAEGAQTLVAALRGPLVPGAEPVRVLFDLARLRRSVEEFCAERGKCGADVRFFRVPPEGPFEAICDAEQVWSTVRGLLQNAFEHGFREGPPSLAPSRELRGTGQDARLSFLLSREEVDVGSRGQMPFVGLAVRNTGAEIPQRELDRVAVGGPDNIFDPESSVLGRKGLGLAYLLNVVRAHRGFVRIASTPEAGTTVAAYLPAARSEDELARYPAGCASVQVLGGQDVARIARHFEASHAWV